MRTVDPTEDILQDLLAVLVFINNVISVYHGTCRAWFKHGENKAMIKFFCHGKSYIYPQ